MKTKIFTIVFLFLSSFISAQDFGVLAGLNEKGVVKVRWFSSEEFNNEGVILYRREKNQDEWIKLTVEPIKKMKKVSGDVMDTSLQIASTLLYNVPDDKEDKETFELTLLTKAILEENFAQAYGMEFNDRDVSEGKTYEYKAAVIKNNSEAYSTISEPITIGKYIAPAAPVKFSGIARDGSATFKWERDEDKFFVYNLYRGEAQGSPKSLVNKTPVFIFEFPDSAGNFHTNEFFYSDTALSNGKTYYYELTGIDYLGRESKRSLPISITPKDLTPPPPPYKVKATPNKNDILITWKTNFVNDLKGFDIYRSKDFKGPYEKVNKKIIGKNDTSYVDQIQSSEERFYYYVTAEDNSSNKSQSLNTVVQVPDWEPPAKPVDLKAIGDAGFIKLSWKKGIEKDLLGYFIYRSVTNTEDEFVLLNPKPIRTNAYTDTLKKEARNYFQYKIVAVDKKYNLSPYSEVVNIQMKDLNPPPAPNLISAEVVDNFIILQWVSSSVEDISGYFVYRSTQDDSTKWTQLNNIQLGSEIVTYKDSIVNEGNYFYSIISLDSAGNRSSRSNLVFAEYIESSPLPAVEGLVISFDKKNNAVNLSWKTIIRNNLLGYVVMRKENADDEFTLAVSPLQNETTFSDTTINTGNSYFYSVKAFDSKGNISISKEIQIDINGVKD